MSEEPRRRKRKKSSLRQIFIGLTILVLILYILKIMQYSLATSLAFGVTLGFVLQKSRFCFAASFRDPILAGTTSLFRSLIISFAIITIGFGVIQHHFFIKTGQILGQIHPIGFHTIFGAVLFGFGMVIAGGCASGTLMRVGEGFSLQMIVLIGFLIGTLWGAKDFPWWDQHFISQGITIHLPQVFGWYGAMIVQLLVLGLLYYLAYNYEKKNSLY